MELKNEIVNFITNKELNGALLISGKWGCGKTYLIKQIANEFNNKKEYAVAIISLFGIDSVSALAQRVKSEYLEISSTLLGKTARKVGKFVKETAQVGTGIAAAATPELLSLAAVNKGISTITSINIFDVLKINNTVGIRNKRDFVLVFDDLERSKIEITDLLGAINEYCENRKIKTIIIANEEEVESTTKNKEDSSQPEIKDVNKKDEDKYKELKEKVISRTLKLKIDHNEIVSSIIKAYRETETGYKDFLQRNLESLVCIFRNSVYDNIRSLKCAIANFERVYKIWQDKNFQTDFIDRLLYSFLIITIEYKANNFRNDIDNCLNFIEKSTLSKYSMDNFRLIRLDTIENWIVYGDWDGEKIYQDILSNTKTNAISAKQKFLHWSIYDLDFSTTESGLKEALEDAYEGLLPYDDVVSLLLRLQAYEELKITFDFNIDYKKIDTGLDKQIALIKAGTFNKTISYNHVASADINSANDKIRSILEKIEYITESIYAWGLRKKLIDFFNKPNGFLYGLDIHYLEEFDQEILEAFWQTYVNGNNRDKCDYLSYIIKINYCFPYRASWAISQRKSILQQTINNFTELKNRLTAQSTQEIDKITKLIEIKHIEEIDDLIKRIEDEAKKPTA